MNNMERAESMKSEPITFSNNNVITSVTHYKTSIGRRIEKMKIHTCDNCGAKLRGREIQCRNCR